MATAPTPLAPAVPSDPSPGTGLAPQSAVLPPPTPSTTFSPRVLNGGFVTALVLCTIVLLGSICYLFWFMCQTGSAVRDLTTQYAQTGRAPGGREPGGTLLGSLSAEQQSRREQAAFATAVNAHVATAGMAYNSCGLFIGVGVAFLGLALFLTGGRGEMDGEGTSERVSVKLARLSPGALAILCASIIIVVCVVRRPTLTLGMGDYQSLVGANAPPVAGQFK